MIYFVTDGNLSVCSVALAGLASGVLHILGGLCLTAVPLYRAVAVLCHRHLRGSVLVQP